MDGSEPQTSPLLSPVEARVLASLMEKELTTPDHYPLTLNATVNACNQKSNRHPVMALTDGDVEQTLETLRRKRLVVLFSGAVSRVPKFKHSFEEVYPVGQPEQVVLCELLLRGPQTPGELRGHCERMHPFSETAAVATVLEDLMDGPGEALVIRLDRQPGQKEVRFRQTLSEQIEGTPNARIEAEPLKVAMALPPEVEERLAKMEQECAALRAEVTELKDLILNL